MSEAGSQEQNNFEDQNSIGINLIGLLRYFPKLPLTSCFLGSNIFPRILFSNRTNLCYIVTTETNK